VVEGGGPRVRSEHDADADGGAVQRLLGDERPLKPADADVVDRHLVVEDRIACAQDEVPDEFPVSMRVAFEFNVGPYAETATLQAGVDGALAFPATPVDTDQRIPQSRLRRAADRLVRI